MDEILKGCILQTRGEYEMNLNSYQIKASRTMAKTGSKEEVAELALGLAGEAGEIADKLKKALYHGHKLNKTDMTLELGDLMWYIAGIATVLEIELNVVGHMNIEKLKKRYPKGFSEVDSIIRRDVEEEDKCEMLKAESFLKEQARMYTQNLEKKKTSIKE